jgi:hypothetical protein
MQTIGISSIKKELEHLSIKELRGLCLAVAKYKKDNKEFIGYQLFNANNVDDFINAAKEEISDLINECTATNYGVVKKKLPKVIRLITKYGKYMNSKAAHADLLLHFCDAYNALSVNCKSYPVIENIYLRQIKKIRTLISGLHEDLQYDYISALEKLENEY